MIIILAILIGLIHHIDVSAQRVCSADMFTYNSAGIIVKYV